MTLIGSADKIRALMSSDPTQKLDFPHLFREKASLTGSLPIASMSRIADMIEEDSGEISYQIQFDNSDDNQQLLSIRINTELKLLCQRCLKPATIEIERSSSLLVVTKATELKNIDGDFEPLVLEEADNLSIQELIQDDLLLAIPVAPVHEASQCEASETLNEINEAGKIKPFAVLESLKKKTN